MTWSDVPRKHWARVAIDFVGTTNDWMRGRRADADGTYRFAPDAPESRRRFARALVRAFDLGTRVEAEASFADLPPSDRSFRWANAVVARGWMVADEQGNFRPREPVTTREVHRAVVLALGMGELAAGADALHLRNGTAIPTPPDFGTTLLGMRLGLRYNHADEALDVGPDSPLSRAEVAWSLYRAANVPGWVPDSLAPYASIELPNLSPRLQRVVAFAADYVGYPYVWGGEWAEPTPAGYCCGYQPTGGFDCSGLVWWVMKAASGGWDNRPPRDYKGWALPERSSAQMAAVGERVRWEDIRPGDLLFYDGSGDGTVDHVNTYLGNGWAIDAANGNAGVTITRVRENWYEDHFVHARRILAR
ncbi:MAG TPA: C40 family peptidase [Actinomycetota bacterium]